MKNFLEVELRFKINSLKRTLIEKKLIEMNAKVIDHSHVIDHWYVSNDTESLEAQDVFYNSGEGYGIRIREMDNGYTGKVTTTLEVKSLLEKNRHDTCIEHEIELNDFEKGNKFLELINHKKMVTVDKDRLVYVLEDTLRNKQKVKVVIDDIKDFAIGVEIEAMIESTSKKDEIIPQIEKIAKDLELDTNLEKVDTSLTSLLIQKKAEFQ
jgi:adenylate cyclase class IV